jgi:anti-sigma regulatory factor (Ser/Thr protein kinase)
MPFYACPNCGSSVSSTEVSAPMICPGCCSLLHAEQHDMTARPLARPRRPKPVVRMPIGQDRGAPAAARRAVGQLRGDLGEARFRVCQLLVSELVTNVLLHAPGRSAWGAADLRVRVYPDRVRIEVRDDGPGFTPHEREREQEIDSGWGLHLVREMADEWGVEPGVQNCVWFELARTPLASGMHAAAHH